jgi:predicted metal-dependent hydrolase
MKKNQRLSLWLNGWGLLCTQETAPEYAAFIALFNGGAYYESHDVLEHLWLQCTDANRSFYQALIQLAGAFVHFQKQLLFPGHPTHGRRLAPGARLLDLASGRLVRYGDLHLNLDVDGLLESTEHWKALARAGGNPLHSGIAPRLAGAAQPFPTLVPGAIKAARLGWLLPGEMTSIEHAE